MRTSEKHIKSVKKNSTFNLIYLCLVLNERIFPTDLQTKGISINSGSVFFQVCSVNKSEG